MSVQMYVSSNSRQSSANFNIFILFYDNMYAFVFG